MFGYTLKRSHEPELMDTEGNKAEYFQSLRHLETVNKYFSCHRRLIRRFFIKSAYQHPGRVWRIADLGAGGCDVALWMREEFRKRNLTTKITCFDKDARVMEYAGEKVAGIEEIKLVKADAEEFFKYGEFDFVLANQILHHIPVENQQALITSIINYSKKSFVLNDVRRSWGTYIGFSLLGLLLFPRSMAYTDGRISIRKGLAKAELAEMLEKISTDKKIICGNIVPGHLFAAGVVRDR